MACAENEILQNVFPVALGTWVLGGMFRGGIDEGEAIDTIHAALDSGINLIDTAPLYGFGRTEELVGKALRRYGARTRVFVATKCGLSWTGGNLYRDARKPTLMQEVDRSLERLGIDCIDLYQLHWLDPATPVEETAGALSEMLSLGKIRSVGLSNCNEAEANAFAAHLPVHSVQPPFNLFERSMAEELLSGCRNRKRLILGYGTLCRGLLSGRIKKGDVYRNDDLRSFDPKFQEPRISRYLQCVRELADWVEKTHGRTLLELAFRWVIDKGVVPLWGPANRTELVDIEKMMGWKIGPEDFKEIDRIVEAHIPDPIGTEFLAPPLRRGNVLLANEFS